MTLLPLVCIPRQDLLFIAAQGLANRHKGALLANAGELLNCTSTGIQNTEQFKRRSFVDAS